MRSTAGAYIDGSDITLTPAQRRAAQGVLAALPAANVCLLRAAAGMGKTTVLSHVQKVVGGSLVQGYEYPRANLINTATSAVLADAEKRGKRFVFAAEGENEPAPVRHRDFSCDMEEFEPEDFACICGGYLGRASDALDFDKIYRYAPALSGYQLKNACLWFQPHKAELGTEAFLEYLRSRNLTSNVDLEEVEAISWTDLKGVDDLIEELEAKIALPFENDALASELGLRPKRGVLLAGPPGTGKTTIGRALARRLKGKFFLLDGRVNAANANFYDRVGEIFEAAKRNAPSVIFIDDADVIFDSGNPGLYRYLLTMMDGLESASAERVCVMITAMDSAVLPPALLRSGRIELWLHPRFPDEQARETILRERLSTLPPPISTVDTSMLACRSRGLSGADLKSVIEEGKLLYARAVASGRDLMPLEKFFIQAIGTCRTNRRSYGKKMTSASGWAAYGFPIF